MFVVRTATAVAVAGLAAIALAMGGAAAGGQRERQSYYGGLPAGGLFQPVGAGPSYTTPEWLPNIGGGFFFVPEGATLLDMKVQDRYSKVVAFDVQFVIDEYAPSIDTPKFCGSVEGLSVPTGTISMIVRVIDIASLKCSPPGLPTTGTIDAIFH